MIVPGVEELDAGDPEFLVIENARRKARAIERPEGAIVIACDTDVVLDGEVLGKPADAADSRRYLDRMSGRGHTVMSGMVVLLETVRDRSRQRQLDLCASFWYLISVHNSDNKC